MESCIAMVSIAERRKAFYTMLQQWDWFDLSLYILNKFLIMISKGSLRLDKYYFVAQPIANTSLLPAGRGKNIVVRMIDGQDGIVKQFPRSAAVIQTRFEQGAKCLAAFKEAQLIGFLWILIGGYQEDTVRARYIPLPAGQVAWDFDVYVAPEFRLSLTFARLWDEANRTLTKTGIRWTCSRISAFNVGSLKIHARLGTVPLGSAVFFCVGRWQITVASIRPYIHLSTQPGSFPEFRLNTQGLDEIPPGSKNGKSIMQ